MTKVQKIWLGVFILIALVPEILFQSTIRLVRGVITIKDISFGHSYNLVLVQSIALLVSTILMFFWRKQIQSKFVFYTLLVLALLWSLIGFLAYYDALFSKISVGGF